MFQALFPNFGGTRETPPKFIAVSLAILLSCFQVTSSAKILFYLGPGSYSHQVATQPLATKLAEIGHEVTYLTPHKPEFRDSKVKVYCPQALIDYTKTFLDDIGVDPMTSRIQNKYADPILDQYYGAELWETYYKSSEATLASQEFGKWIQKSKFDLVITEQHGKELSLGIAHRSGAKVIGFTPAPMWPIDADLFGMPTEASWYSGWTLNRPYSFIPNHFYNEWNALIWQFKYQWTYLPRIDTLMRKTGFFKDNLPYIGDLVKGIDMFFINTHFSNEYARSLPPFVVSVGGMHVKETSKPLPKNLEDFITGGSDGFVYISFGSILKISGLPQETQTAFFSAIASFKNARFLLKWEGEVPKDMPKNILPMNWFPQQDVLAHPKIRGFVSQGGLMSFQQATFHGVPVVVMPVYWDQPFIAQTAEDQGVGIHLELADITLDSVSNAIKQLLYNQSLSKQAKEVSRRYKDRPMSPVDTAVWWTEYVLRHNDTSHLKPLGIYQTWWQRRLLDFWALVFFISFLINLAMFLVIRSLIRLCTKAVKVTQDKIKSL